MRTIAEIKKELMQAIIEEIGQHKYFLHDAGKLDRVVGNALAEASNRDFVSEYIECRVCYTKNYLQNSKIVVDELPENEKHALINIAGICPKIPSEKNKEAFFKLHTIDMQPAAKTKEKSRWKFWW